jgi:hypothetical protein
MDMIGHEAEREDRSSIIVRGLFKDMNAGLAKFKVVENGLFVLSTNGDRANEGRVEIERDIEADFFP